MTALGLPESVRACLFDLDGVLTRTAKVHSAAWKQMFDDFLRTRADQGDGEFREFTDDDYRRYVDGKPRADGTRSFLESRDIDLPEGSDDDTADDLTVVGLGVRKNDLVRHIIDTDGVETFDDSIRYVRAVGDAGLKRAVVTSSRNCEQVLDAAGIADLFDARIDGNVARRHGLAGKPAPDTFLAGAKALGVDPEHAAVFEDALSGVEAGHAGGFAHVVGVDRTGDADGLRRHGADVVVTDLADLLGAS